MASNYNRKSGSSGSNRNRKSGYTNRSSTRKNSSRPSSRQPQSHTNRGYTSVRIGDIDRQARDARVKKSQRRFAVRLGMIATLLVVLIVGGVVLYSSPAFTVTNVKVTGVEHLTATEMTELAAVPEGTTLLRLGADGIKSRLTKNAWVESVNVKRVFPDTLELVVTEREITAVVEVPVKNASAIERWAIASDEIWLMAIPDKDSPRAAAVSTKVYEDAEYALVITDVSASVSPQVGSVCTDAPINNALAIVDGMTTELAGKVKKVSATGSETATLTLDDGIEIAFGTADNIRDKERICLKLMEDNPGKIAYINVSVIDRPTWRSL